MVRYTADMKRTLERWNRILAFVGVTCEQLPPEKYAKCVVKLRIPRGIASFGRADTIEEAINHASCGIPIDWYSVERRMDHQETELAWAQMAHL